MPRDRNYLFTDYDLRQTLENHETKMYREIDSIEPNRLLNTSVNDLCDYFEAEYLVEAPQLREDQVTVDQGETQIDVSQDRNRYIRDRSRPFHITGVAVTFFVPFEGDAELFKCRPSSYTTAPPMAEVSKDELRIRYTKTDHDAERLKTEFQREIGEIGRYLGWVQNDVAAFNKTVRQKAETRINHRREKLLKDQGLAAGLGFPMRERPGATKTYVTPEVRRKPKVEMPKASTEPYVQEPVLDLGDYEHILSVVNNMVLVMERSPHAFHDMNEEDLRQHFLVQLNGQYEGQATGETFNYQGKTDILIRVEGKNIFIGECKFWHGPKGFTETMDQVLGYTSWRDTKTALFIFNRQKNLSNIIGQIPGLMENHPNFKCWLDYKAETGFRAVFHHNDDKNREIIMTVLIFDIPKNG